MIHIPIMKPNIVNTYTFPWVSSSAIISGISSTGTDNPTPVFWNYNGDIYLIYGEVAGTFQGYKWNTTTDEWDSNTAIVSGLTDIGLVSSPTIFELNGTWYIHSTDRLGNRYGFVWGGSSWSASTYIINGLPKYTDEWPVPNAFWLDGDLYMFTGTKSYNIYGHKWNTTTEQWDDATSYITNGIDDNINYITMKAFWVNGDLYASVGGFNLNHLDGYKWNTTTEQWDTDTDYVSGLPTTSAIGSYPSVAVHEVYDELWMIIGKGNDNNWLGYKIVAD